MNEGPSFWWNFPYFGQNWIFQNSALCFGQIIRPSVKAQLLSLWSDSGFKVVSLLANHLHWHHHFDDLFLSALEIGSIFWPHFWLVFQLTSRCEVIKYNSSCELSSIRVMAISHCPFCFTGKFLKSKLQNQPKPAKASGPLHALWQVSFGFWVTWSISSWQKYYKSVFFLKLSDE